MRVGIAGLGTVGARVAAFFFEKGHPFHAAPFELRAVSARERTKSRGFPVDRVAWEDSAPALAARDDLDVVVELIGGVDGAAPEAIETAIASGKHVVSANKALLATHGLALAVAADRADVSFLCEAAIAGGVPIVSTMRSQLAAGHVSALTGILNGTCNYIISALESDGGAYDTVLAEAQRLGFAEADPHLDVSGIDAAQKLCLLTTMATGHVPQVNWDAPQDHVLGIERLSPADFHAAAALGRHIRLVGRLENDAGQAPRLALAPMVFRADHPLARARGPDNAIRVEAEPVDHLFLAGPGAGAGPTASAVAGDLIALAAGARHPLFARPADTLRPVEPASPSADGAAWFLRLSADDQFAPAIRTLLDEAGCVARAEEGRFGLSLETKALPIDLARTLAEHLAPETSPARTLALGHTGARTFLRILNS